MRLKQQLPKGMDQLMGPREGAQQFDPLRFKLIYNQRMLDLQKEETSMGGGGKEKCLDLSFKREDDDNVEEACRRLCVWP